MSEVFVSDPNPESSNYDWIFQGLASGEYTNFQTNENLIVNSPDDLIRIENDYVVGQFDLSRYDNPLGQEHQAMLACGPTVILQTGLMFADRTDMNKAEYSAITDQITDVLYAYKDFRDVDLDSIQVPQLKQTVQDANKNGDEFGTYRDFYSYGGMTPGSVFLMNQDFAYKRGLDLEFRPMGDQTHVTNPYYQFSYDKNLGHGYGERLPFTPEYKKEYYKELQEVLEDGGISVISRHPIWNGAFHYQVVIDGIDLNGNGILEYDKDYLVLIDTISPNDSIQMPETLNRFYNRVRANDQGRDSLEVLRDDFFIPQRAQFYGQVNIEPAGFPGMEIYSAYGIVPRMDINEPKQSGPLNWVQTFFAKFY